jgi:hypothetical protein
MTRKNGCVTQTSAWRDQSGETFSGQPSKAKDKGKFDGLVQQ